MTRPGHLTLRIWLPWYGAIVMTTVVILARVGLPIPIEWAVKLYLKMARQEVGIT